MTLPTLVIVGRPNVGKSTLFNNLTRSRDALVADLAGVTRDRQYGHGDWEGNKFIVIDTGGMMMQDKDYLLTLALQQTQQALEEADIILFMVSARDGVMTEDEIILKQLRRYNKPLHLVVNKIDGVNLIETIAVFSVFGIELAHYISTAHRRGITALVKDVLPVQPQQEEKPNGNLLPIASSPLHLAIVGRPNVGKSTFTNRILGEERVLVSDIAGTTRDSISIPIHRRGRDYVLIDTAGMRRRHKVYEAIEKFSMIKSLQAIAASNVSLVMMDATAPIAEQDLRILRFVLEAGKSLVIVINKWDSIPSSERSKLKADIVYRLQFVDFAKLHFISAKSGDGVGKVFLSVDDAYRSAMTPLSTPQLTRILEKAVATHQPPLVNGRRIKLRYAHSGGHNPPCIIIHGKQVNKLSPTYQRYLLRYFRESLKLLGTPIRFIFKNDKNPYQDP